MELVARGRVVVEGVAEGPLLRLTRPISLWGGVDPQSGMIVDPRHPQHGTVVSGVVLVVPSTVGSSSSSAIMLELIREGVAPAAVVTGQADAILAVGVVVARELGYHPVPLIELHPDQVASVGDGERVRVTVEGGVERTG